MVYYHDCRVTYLLRQVTIAERDMAIYAMHTSHIELMFVWQYCNAEFWHTTNYVCFILNFEDN